jgi:hypothetical protein
MAIYRQIQTSFWQDDFVLQLTPEEKYFYLYLLTNSKTKQCGIYQLPMQVVIMETGYNQETVDKLLKRFIDYGKVIHNPQTKEIGIVNWPKYNPMESPKTRACVEKELKEVKDKSIIAAIYPARYPIQGASQEEEEQEQEKAEAEEKEEPAREPASAADNFNNEKIPLHSCHPRPQIIGDPMSCQSDNVPDYNCTSIQMQSELLLTRVWNKQKPNPEEIRITADYIIKFTFNEVEIAFKEAVKYDRKKLAYVETVCEKRKERSDLKKKNELEKQKRLDQEKKLEEERKSGVGLGLIKIAFPDG